MASPPGTCLAASASSCGSRATVQIPSLDSLHLAGSSCSSHHSSRRESHDSLVQGSQGSQHAASDGGEASLRQLLGERLAGTSLPGKAAAASAPCGRQGPVRREGISAGTSCLAKIVHACPTAGGATGWDSNARQGGGCWVNPVGAGSGSASTSLCARSMHAWALLLGGRLAATAANTKKRPGKTVPAYS